MKKVILILSGIIFFSSIGFGQGNTLEPTKVIRGVTDIKTGISAPNATNILVLRDVLPWSINVTVPYLITQGAIVSTGTSADIPTLDFSQFNGIVIESVQPESFKAVVAANLSKFETFVSNGGCLEYHAVSWSSDPSPMTLPGGVISYFNYPGTTYELNYVVAASHPIAAGQPSPFNGYYANHNIFQNLYPGTTVITTSPNNEPTTIEYQFGNGRVTATGCTYEYYQYPIFFNNLNYTLTCGSIEPPVETPVSNWALALGVLLIVVFTVFRMRRIS